MNSVERVISPAPQPLIDGKLSQIESRISGLFDQSAHINQAVNRLVNPAPEPVDGANANKVSSNTVETRMSIIVDQLDKLQNQFSHISERLDGAV